MRIKEAARLSGLSEQTIRYYESRGLVIPDMEEKNGRLWRDYREEHVRLLSAVATLRRACFHVEEIAELLEDPEKIPDTLREVRARIDENYDVLGKLRVRMNQEDVASAEDVLSLAERLNEAAAPLALPEGDVKYDSRAGNRDLKERKPLFGVLSGKLLLLTVCLWLIAMALLTCSVAGDLLRQGASDADSALEAYLDRLSTDAADSANPDREITPFSPMPFLRETKMELWGANLTINDSGIIVSSEGFDIGSASAANTGITVTEGRLALIISSAQMEGAEAVASYGGLTPTYNQYSGAPASGYLTFRVAPQRKGSFPSAEFPESFPEQEGRFDASKPVSAGNRTPMRLLDGIDSGEYHFDANHYLQSSRIAGKWLRDTEGTPVCFVLAAYGWSPLFTSMKMLVAIYLISLAVFLLSGLLLSLSLRKPLIRSLLLLERDLSADPLTTSEHEFDYAWQYQELQDVTTAYLLRKQMSEASKVAPLSGVGAALLFSLENAQSKLSPILKDRGQEIRRELNAEGTVCAAEPQLENALLALLRESIDYTEDGHPMILRTLEKTGFLLTEVQIRTKRTYKSAEFSLLWNGIYRVPASGNAPGAELRKAVAAIPGSFCAVRRTKTGLVLTLGLPQMQKTEI